MGFRSGDDVVHPTYGVGSILRLEERQLAEAELRWYYVLAVGKNTVWMPVQSDESHTLRSVTAQHELDQYRTLLKSRPATLERDYNRRRQPACPYLKPFTKSTRCCWLAAKSTNRSVPWRFNIKAEIDLSDMAEAVTQVTASVR